MRRRAGAGLGKVGGLLLAALMAGCGREPEAELAPPRVEYFGCWAVDLPGPLCRFRPGSQFELWVEAEAVSEVVVTADGEPLAAEGLEAGGGWRFPLAIPAGATSLAVHLGRNNRPPGPGWSLRLAPPEEVGWLGEIQALLGAGKIDKAKELLKALLSSAPVLGQALLLRALAMAAEAGGDREGAIEAFARASAADRTQGRLSGEVGNGVQQARLELEAGRFAAARQTLDALPALEPLPATLKVEVAFYRGLLADAVGDFRRALAALRAAAELAARLDLSHRRWQVELVLARLYSDLGRRDEAEPLFARLAASSDPERPCDRAVLLDNRAWSWLMAREGGAEPPDPTPLLEEARTIFDQQACRGATGRLNVRMNLALAHLSTGHPERAEAVLAEARPLVAEANRRQLWEWQGLAGRLASAQQRPAEARRHYLAMRESAEAALSPDGGFRAALGLARAELAAGDRAAALATLAAAEPGLAAQVWQIPLHEGRETFLAAREEATRLQLDLLLANNRPQEALALARRSRARLLGSLLVRDRLGQLNAAEQRSWDQALSELLTLRNEIDHEAATAWQAAGERARRRAEQRRSRIEEALARLDRAISRLGAPATADALASAPPRPGELLITYHPLPQGWVGVAAGQGTIQIHRFELSSAAPTSPEALAADLLEPFRAEIGAAERLRLLPAGSLRAVDFHALPLAGEPLLAHLPVAYGLDLPGRAASEPEGRPLALVVADPEGDLPAARREAVEVAASLAQWPGWDVARLDRQAATAAALRSALPTADLLHFAGHGSFAGFAGWDSVLRLAEGSRWTPADTLALPRAPRWVLLSSCEAARSSPEAPGEGIGVAQAFLLAGARAVVAATRPVPDETARKLFSLLYRSWRPGQDLAAALATAQRTCRRADPTADWASFRVLEP